MEKKSRGARLHLLPLEPMMLAADRPGHRCERPEQGGGRQWPTSLNSKAQESLPWQGARGRLQPAQQGHLLPHAPAIPRGPEEMGGGHFPGPGWVQQAAGSPGQLLPPSSASCTR